MKKNIKNKQQFTICNKKITIYPCYTFCPIIYINTFSEESDYICQLLYQNNCPDVTLVFINELNWNHDMSPWKIPPISKGDIQCTGGADEYLKLLINEIMPKVENEIIDISWKGLAGYSLAGLFAVYSLYQTNLFTRIASISGSLWFPNLKEYIFSNEMKIKPEKLYFSLGDKECKTANPYLKSVQENTAAIESFYKTKNITSIFQLNHGNHHKNITGRTAAGIQWLLE